MHTHTTILLLFWNMSGTTRVSRYQKGKTRKVKTNLDLLEQEIVSGSGICWAICKSSPHPRQPRQHPTTQFFTGRMPFLPPNQQRQSTEAMIVKMEVKLCYVTKLNQDVCRGNKSTVLGNFGIIAMVKTLNVKSFVTKKRKRNVRNRQELVLIIVSLP